MRRLVIACSLGGCLGVGHVYRGVRAEAATDLACPGEQVDVQGLDSMNERFRARGCGREAYYDWVEGRAVRDGAVRDAKEADAARAR